MNFVNIDAESFFRELENFGVPVEFILEFAIFGPVLLFLATMALYAVSTYQRRMRLAQEKVARGILSGARKRSTTLSQQEITDRLRPKEDDGSSTRKSILQIAEILLKLVNFNKQEAKYKLVQAGQRDPRALSRYIIQRGMGMVIGPAILWFLAGTFLGLSGFFQFGISLIGILVGGIVVDVQLDKAVTARRAKIHSELPVLLDLLTIYLEAGQAFDVALARASTALKVSFPTAAAEIFYLRQDLETTVEREKCLREFASRLGTQTARTFIAIVVQSERRGNPIAPSLRTLARESRKEVMSDIEKKAQKIPTMMQLPMFLFILPSIFAAVIAPAAVQIMEKFGNGGMGG
jgi:tight adherence protein C